MGVSCLSDRCTRPTLQRGSPQEKKESEKMDDKEEEVMAAEEHIKETLPKALRTQALTTLTSSFGLV